MTKYCGTKGGTRRHESVFDGKRYTGAGDRAGRLQNSEQGPAAFQPAQRRGDAGGFLRYLDEQQSDPAFQNKQQDDSEFHAGVPDKRLQDLLHGLEFAADENEKRRAGTKLQQSRRIRREAKDEVKRLELIVRFFDEPNPKNTLNKMRQLLGKQRKEEEYLNGERHYNNRMPE